MWHTNDLHRLCCSVLASAFAQHSAGYVHNPYGDVSEGEDETSHTGALNGSRFNGRTPLQVIRGNQDACAQADASKCILLRVCVQQEVHMVCTTGFAITQAISVDISSERQQTASWNVLQSTEVLVCTMSQAAAGAASLPLSQTPAYAALARHAAHAAAASAPPQPRLPDHLGAPSGGGRDAPLGQAADDLTFNSTIKDRLAGIVYIPAHSQNNVFRSPAGPLYAMYARHASRCQASPLDSRMPSLHLFIRFRPRVSETSRLSGGGVAAECTAVRRPLALGCPRSAAVRRQCCS